MANPVTFQNVERNGWQWQIADAELLSGWFDSFCQSGPTNVVKQNRLRTVFKTQIAGCTCYVKHDHPQGVVKNLKARMRSKVLSEFESAMALVAANVPVVDYVGVGRKGGQGLLLSREPLKVHSARDWWFERACREPALRESYLGGFARFLRTFLAAGFHHPDFHLGNLLYQQDGDQFLLVDVYGVSACSALSDKQRHEMEGIVGSLRGELSDEEGAALLAASGVSNQNERWQSIVAAESKEMEKLWPKRREQILSGRSKYCSRLQLDGKEWWIRHSVTNKPIMALNDFSPPEEGDSQWSSVSIDVDACERSWLNSFRLQFHRIPASRPVLWNRTDHVLYFESLAPEDQGGMIASELLERCRLAELPISGEQLIELSELRTIVDSQLPSL